MLYRILPCMHLTVLECSNSTSCAQANLKESGMSGTMYKREDLAGMMDKMGDLEKMMGAGGEAMGGGEEAGEEGEEAAGKDEV